MKDVYEAIEKWLCQPQVSIPTQLTYQASIKALCKDEIINTELSCKDFLYADHDEILAAIYELPNLSEGTKQLRASCYNALINFMSKTLGIKVYKMGIRRNNAVFKAYLARSAKSLSLDEWKRFIIVLKNMSQRESIIARCFMGCLFSTKILNLKVSELDYQNNCIRYGNGSYRAFYPSSFMDEIKVFERKTCHIRGDSPLLFVTNQGKRIVRSRLNYAFRKASKLANVPLVTPYVCRATFLERVERDGINPEELV